MRHEGFWEGEQKTSEDCFEKTITAVDLRNVKLILEGQMTWQRVLHWLQYARLSTKQAQTWRTSEQEADC